jgi:hypothetical protein
MPRYFFDTHNGHHPLTDDEGQELDGPTSVRAEALAALSDMTRDGVRKAYRDAMVVSVRDEARQVVFKATLSLQIEQQSQ